MVYWEKMIYRVTYGIKVGGVRSRVIYIYFYRGSFRRGVLGGVWRGANSFILPIFSRRNLEQA